MRNRQIETHVNQCDETPLKIIHVDRPAGSKSYTWIHITGELSPVLKVVVYEYRKIRYRDHYIKYLLTKLAQLIDKNRKIEI